MNILIIWINAKEKRKSNQTNETIEDNIIDALKLDITDKRRLHQKRYRNLAKIFQSGHKKLCYRDALQYVYKNN